MANIFDSLTRRLLGQAYTPVSNGQDGEQTPQIPGAFAASSEDNAGGRSEGEAALSGDAGIGEGPAALQRAAWTSHNVQHALFRLRNMFQLLVYQPLMVILLIICRALAAFLNIIYFRDEHVASGANRSDRIDNADRFIRELEYNLSPSQPMHSLPPFFQGSYTQALFMATNRAKFLFVYLAHPSSENSVGMFENIVTAPEFTAFFNDPAFIIWGGDLTSSESYQLANSLNVTKFPFLGLMCLTRTTTMMPLGPVKSVPKISLILKVQGRINDRVKAQNIISTKFRARISKYDGDLKDIRDELMNKFVSQVLVKQQNINYQNLLARDRAKKQKKEREGKFSAYLKLRAAYFDELQKQPPAPNKARVGIRFADGTRVTLALPDTVEVPEIYEFVEIHRRGYAGGLQDGPTQSTAQSLQVAPDDFKFTLVSSVPPRSLLRDFWQSSVREVDFLYPNGMLIVEDS